jgi:hypothetical protein
VTAAEPSLDFASLRDWMADEATRPIIGTAVVARWYGRGAQTGDLPPVISIELRGQCLAFVKPDLVRFPATLDGSLPAAREWLSRIVADNGLGSAATRVRVTVAPHERHWMLAIDGDKDRLLTGNDYLTEQEQEEVA